MELRALPPVKAKAKPDFPGLYGKALWNTHIRIGEGQTDAATWLRTIYYSVKLANHFDRSEPKSLGEAETRFCFYEMTMRLIGTMTPRQMLRIFPITKTFDGAKWQIKDYFSSMEALEEHGMDEMLEDHAMHVLWDYMNLDITVFMVGLMSAMSAIRRFQGEKDLLEEFFEDKGIAMHTLQTDPETGKQYLQNGDTGKITPVKKPKPRYLNLVETKRK